MPLEGQPRVASFVEGGLNSAVSSCGNVGGWLLLAVGLMRDVKPLE